jgi:hypothetical protein
MSLFAVIAAKSLPWAVMVRRRQSLACHVDACMAVDTARITAHMSGINVTKVMRHFADGIWRR